MSDLISMYSSYTDANMFKNNTEHIHAFIRCFVFIVILAYIYILGYWLVSINYKLTNKVKELEKQLFNITSQLPKMEEQFNDKINTLNFNAQTNIINSENENNNKIKEIRDVMLLNNQLIATSFDLVKLQNAESVKNMMNKIEIMFPVVEKIFKKDEEANKKSQEIMRQTREFGF